MHWVDWQQQQHRLDWVESVLLQLCGGGKSQHHMAGARAPLVTAYWIPLIFPQSDWQYGTNSHWALPQICSSIWRSWISTKYSTLQYHNITYGHTQYDVRTLPCAQCEVIMASEFGYIKCYVQYVVTGPDLGGGPGPRPPTNRRPPTKPLKGKGRERKRKMGGIAPPPFWNPKYATGSPASHQLYPALRCYW